MPNHCYQASNITGSPAPNYYNWDWTVTWNSELPGNNIGSGQLITNPTTSALLCDNNILSASNIPPSTSITFNQGADITQAVGITIDNTLIFQALNPLNQDMMTSS